MDRLQNAHWWYWLVTVGCLAAELLFQADGHQAAILLTFAQIAHFAVRENSFTTFPLQVRIAYLGLLLLAIWPPLRILLWVQLIGTTAMVLVNYCFLARCLSLLPWNRHQPLTGQLFWTTFVSPPVAGSVAQR